MNRKSAIAAIDRAGILLVFPLDNRKEPASIWSHFFPKEAMRWEWDEDGDNRVGDLWHLRSELSTTRKVIYAKWFRGRATYFSLPVFTAMLRSLNPRTSSSQEPSEGLSSTARRLLEVLESESPLSTKELKRMADLKGRANERVYEKAMGELWSRLLIVAYGEVDDGAFPSLAVGSTKVLFEDLWNEAFAMDPGQADRRLGEKLAGSRLFLQQYLKIKRDLGTVAPMAAQGPAPVAATKKKRKAAPEIKSVIRFEDL